jgi:hypothetical protein
MLGAFGIGHATWTGSPLPNTARWRRTRVSIQGRPADTECPARCRDRHDRIGEIFHQIHQLSSSVTGKAMPKISCAFFWSAMMASAMWSLRSRTALRLVSSLLRRSFASSLGLAPHFARLEPSRALRAELPTPRRQHRAVDAFLTEHGLEGATLAAGQASIRLLHDPQLLCRVECAPRASWLCLYSCAAGAERTQARLAFGHGFTNWDLGWLRQGLGSILRPTALTIPEGAVSRDIGTGGSGEGAG